MLLPNEEILAVFVSKYRMGRKLLAIPFYLDLTSRSRVK